MGGKGAGMTLWAAKWRAENQLNGKTEHFIYWPGASLALGFPRLFRTRREARQFINDHYSYIRRRPDLRAEPHGWKLPIPVKVNVQVAEITEDTT